MPDTEYDALERWAKQNFPDSTIPDTVGSSNAHDYPPYIREGRRPLYFERRYPTY